MAKFAESHPWRGNVFEREPELTEQVLKEIAERGPLGSRHFEGSGRGGMWNWKPAKIVLEALHSAGEARRSPGGTASSVCTTCRSACSRLP